MSGGCIADAAVAEFADGSRAFVKRSAGNPDMFQREAEGLRALSAASALRVPEVLAADESALVLECIEAAPRRSGFAATFGRRFACLHRCEGNQFGFEHDNYLGLTPQINTPMSDDWAAFFLEKRLWFQVHLAGSKGRAGDLERLLERAESRIDDLLSTVQEPPSLLHGDLWSGNFIVDDRGEACLIDPAVYYGHREADLAMTRLFGGFEPAFYAAYEEEWPLEPGHEERLLIYQLYHLLNHLNLFGGGYYDQSRRILARFAG